MEHDSRHNGPFTVQHIPEAGDQGGDMEGGGTHTRSYHHGGPHTELHPERKEGSKTEDTVYHVVS